MIETEIGFDIEKAASFLKNGELVAIPTETVYGLAANALDIKAVAKIFEAKNRPTFDPLILHVSGINQIHKYVLDFPKEFEKIAKKYCPGPITFLLPKKSIIPDLVTSGLDKVAIRIPNHEVTLKLLAKLDFPLAAPSANPFGYISPTSALHVAAQLDGKLPYILDGESCKIGVESTIIGIEGKKVIVYRKGGLSIDSLIELIEIPIEIRDFSSSTPKAPGMLKRHYSPNKDVSLLKGKLARNLEKVGYLGFSKYNEEIPFKNQYLLSEKGDLAEAAQRLFSGLRWLDNLNIDRIYLELVPEEGLGVAINDRLKRAAAED